MLALADCQPQVVESYGFGVQIAKPALGAEADVMKLATWTLGLSSKRCSGTLVVECGMSLFAASGLSEFLCSRLRVGSIDSDEPAPHITRQAV